MGNRDDHVFFDDHVLDVDVLGADDDLRPPFIAVAFLDLLQFGDDHIQNLPGIVQDTLAGRGSGRVSSAYSASIFSRSRPVRRWSRISRMALAWTSRQTETAAQGDRASWGLAAALITAMTSSIRSRAMISPSRIWARSLALASSKLGPADDDLACGSRRNSEGFP